MSLRLCQCRLGLRQPEGHLHGAVEVNGGGECGAGQLVLAGGGIQRAEAAVAVRLERPHAEFLGQTEGLAVVSFGLIALRRFAPRRNLTKEAQGIRLTASFPVSTGVFEDTGGEGVRLLQAAGVQIRLAQGEELCIPDRRGTA